MKRKKSLAQIDREIELIKEKVMKRMFGQPRGF
jgi:hypothetical protein